MEPTEPRDPESGDLLKVCRALNERGARYIVIGGMALVYHGFNRGTEDIDLMASACGIDFKEASNRVEEAEIEGVRIPFANPELLLKTKLTVREKDENKQFLKTIRTIVKPTIELPDDILQRAKIAAARRRTTLKNLVIEGLEGILREEAPTGITAPNYFPKILDFSFSECKN